MPATLRPDPSGQFVAVDVNGVERLRVNADGSLVASSSPAQGDDSLKLVTTALLRDLAIGLDQTWQDVLGSRALGTIYTNTTGRPIALSIRGVSASASVSISLEVNGVAIAEFNDASANAAKFTVSGIVPPGATYRLTASNFPISVWAELR